MTKLVDITPSRVAGAQPSKVKVVREFLSPQGNWYESPFPSDHYRLCDGQSLTSHVNAKCRLVIREEE